MKKLLCTFLTIVFVLVVMVPSLCFAIEEEPFEPPINIDDYELTSSIIASLSISGGSATVAGRVGSKFSGASCSVTVKLQKKSGNSWINVKTWTSSGTSSASAGGTYSVSSGSYRTYVSAVITFNGDSEHPYKYSGTKTC